MSIQGTSDFEGRGDSKERRERVEKAPQLSVDPTVGAANEEDQNSPRLLPQKSDAPVSSQTESVPTEAHGEPVEVSSESDSVVAVQPNVQLPAPPPPRASIRLEPKHPLAIRWMHWINFPVLTTMIWSGLLIYWADSDIAYHHPHQVYRIGIGSFTLFRFFPNWFWTWYHAPYQITTGLGYHFFFMWFFALNGLFYVLYTIFSGEWRFLVPGRSSFREAIDVALHDIGLRKGPLPHRKFNGAQQIAYTSIILMGLGSLITGLAIYKPAQAHWITTLLGGYEVARWLHFWLTMGYCVFFLIHVSQVIKAGWNNFRAMVSGHEIVPADEAPYVPQR